MVHSLYWNGSLLKQQTSPSNPEITYTGPVSIGAESGSLNHYYEGEIDDVRIYNRALSASEIKELYGDEPPPDDCYDQGYAAGQAACKANPASCGITVPGGGAITLTPDLKMHIPNIQYTSIMGVMSIWADLAYDGTKTDGTYFKVTGAGEN